MIYKKEGDDRSGCSIVRIRLIKRCRTWLCCLEKENVDFDT